ncbi:MAG TPA: Crp/Fnr family transcriptional regulator [Burkholderiaceae bacterium]|nr:Crp/Fnr family transcriptional regulator [Burkholderiaceae bacterium]
MDALATDPVLAAQRGAAPTRPPLAVAGGHAGLRDDEFGGLQAGRWFGELSVGLREAILARARVHRVVAGTRIAQRGDAGGHWVGVARGALRLGTALPDGRVFTLDFMGPGQWFGDIALVDGRAEDLDMVAHVPSTLLVVSKADMHELMGVSPEFRDALLQLNCQRLRRMVKRCEERHALSLPQRLARQVLRLARRFGRAAGNGLRIDLAVSQGDLASMVGGSRQRVNRALRQMQQLGIMQLGPQRLLVLDLEGLDDVASGRTVLPGSTTQAD